MTKCFACEQHALTTRAALHALWSQINRNKPPDCINNEVVVIVAMRPTWFKRRHRIAVHLRLWSSSTVRGNALICCARRPGLRPSCNVANRRMQRRGSRPATYVGGPGSSARSSSRGAFEEEA